MALTLAQSATLSQNMLHRGIMEELVKESPILRLLPFIEVEGNALAINREDTDAMGSAGFYGANAVWNEDAATFDQVTASLTTLGGEADVPNLAQKSRSNFNDQMAAQVKIKTKLMGHAFEDCFIYGDDSDSHEFDGLHTLMATVPSARKLSMGTNATGAALTLAKLDELVDVILGGQPDIILMNKNIRRRLTQKLRTVGSYTTERDDYGNFWVMWNEIPIVVTDFLLQTEAISSGVYDAKTGGLTSSVFAIRFGDGDGLCGIQSGGIQTETWERLEEKDASRTRIKWYCGLALYATTSIARIDGVTDAAIS